MIAVDTNILIYASDDSEPAKQAKARVSLARLVGNRSQARMLWQVLGEYLRYLRKLLNAGDITDQQLAAEFDIARKMFPISFPTEAVLDRALALGSQYSLSHWDSMLPGACEAAGVTELHTEDMGSPRTIGSVQLRNPLV